MEYIEVLERKLVPMNCTTCLYASSDRMHCAHADNKGKLMIQVNEAQGCAHYWLDQHRFMRA